jgi:hypothetical protein
MEDKIVPCRRQGGNPLGHVLFHDTAGTEADRANITASITADTAPELLNPDSPFLRYWFFAEIVFWRICFGHWRYVLPRE